MPYRIPDDATIIAAARDVLRDAQSIQTQRELRQQVADRLRKDDPTFTVGEERVRRLVANQDFVRVEFQARRGSRERILNKCPVCRAPLSRLKNQTLFGGEVTLTLRCPTCGYWTGKEKRVPTRYVFHYEGRGRGRVDAAAKPIQVDDAR